MAVPYTFANATTSIPLSQLDSNFATSITLGTTPVVLGNTYTTLANVTFSNVTISNVVSANLASNATVDGTNSVGFLGIPQDAQTGNYTITLSDSGKHIYHAPGAAAATYTIPNNATTAFTTGTAVSFVNMSANNVTIAISTDTLYLASTGNTASRTLAQYGVATAIKIASTSWIISGSALT